MGIVLVYRSSRVINFAVTSLGFIGAGIFALLVAQYGVPFWIAAAVGLVLGVVRGGHRAVGHPPALHRACWVIVLVATIGIAQLSLAILAFVPAIDDRGARFPLPIGAVRDIVDIRITGPSLTILIVVPLLAVGLGGSSTGRPSAKVKASADNPDLARLAGISPKAVLSWRAGHRRGLATLSLSLLAAQPVQRRHSTTSDPAP